MWHCKKKKVFPSSIILTHVWWYWWHCVLILLIIIQPFFVLKSHLAFAVALGQMCQAAHTKCSPERHLAVRHWILIFWIQTRVPCISSPSWWTQPWTSCYRTCVRFPSYISLITNTWSGNVQPQTRRSNIAVLLALVPSLRVWILQSAAVEDKYPVRRWSLEKAKEGDVSVEVKEANAKRMKRGAEVETSF